MKSSFHSCTLTNSTNLFPSLLKSFSTGVLRDSLNSNSVRVRVRVTLRLAVYRQSVRLGDKPLETHDNFIFQLNFCSYSPYVSSSLTRESVCLLQLPLVLTSAVILRSESHGNHDHILQSQIRGSTNLEGQVPVFISPRNKVAQLYPQALDYQFF
jgi:hypothetical protein